MKHISIITGSELRMVMGVNYYIKSFLKCNQYFKDYNVNRVYSSLQTLKVDEGEEIPIGIDKGKTEYKIRRGIRTVLRKLLTDKFYPFALFRYRLNSMHVSKSSVERFFEDNTSCDYIIFQELGCAEYYFKHLHKYANRQKAKTLLIVHSEDDSGSMLINKFSGYGKNDMRKRFNAMRDYVYNRIDKVVYISEKAYNASALENKKKAFVYNGCPNVHYTFNEKKNDITNFVCVGSIDGRKGQEKILEAMKLMDSSNLSKMHMTFVGDGTLRKSLEDFVKTYGLTNYVTFTGSRNDVPEILRSHDVFIMPSTVEGLPMSAIEGMRAGLFLILTDTGGNAELCDEGCGFICTRDPLDIMRKMYNVMNEEVIGVFQKENSRARFLKNFSLECMAEGYENVLKSL
jgi:glycosyltransferase involved in cell wall biosynthesis